MVIDGWTVFAHPLLLDQLERATAAVEAAKAADPTGYQRTAQAKLLAMLATLIFETIPSDPTRQEYRQGDTLGRTRKHWFRAKFGNGRFRLFFRYDSRTKILIFAWVNDETTLRTYGSKTDAYRVFKGMLDKGNPPDDWKSLLAAASAEPAGTRLEKAKPT
ncbi:type II toxin-antitoxin system YhaV family toxin [Methylobacterium bullatum]|uniref:Ribonuclease toxin YhaV n=1 Tax=Methylobacterium bullatum TaxID=570505 RepID=A0AAV4Z882_9HYPH|nr:type II toxin-antitoxin system YhaV family toxin [Methylobacterium bullatum]MBD8904787.1 toxin [Methylobacterium bullatum]GJD40162.1 Ribonuclease toxin YhaV [Methylobacterium bullatum]